MRRTVLTILASLVVSCAYSSVVKGKIPADSKRATIVISICSEFVTSEYKQISRISSNKNGYFEANIRFNGEKKVKLTVGEKTVFFYARDTNEYTIVNNDNKLNVLTHGLDRNVLLNRISDELNKWQSLWVNGNGEFINQYPITNVWDSLAAIKRQLNSSFKNYSDAIDYRFAHAWMRYIVYAYSKQNRDSANFILNNIEKKFISDRPVDIENEDYMQLFKLVVESRCNNLRFRRIKDKGSNPFSRMLKEDDLFTKDSLRDLSKALTIKFFYDNKLFGHDTDIKKFNALALDCSKDFRTGLKSLVEKLVELNNEVKLGDRFPSLRLPNENGNMWEIDSLQVPYILIDFWATWCYPCKVAMRKFPNILAQNKGKLMIVSISIDGNSTEMKTFFNANNYNGKWKALYNGETGHYLDKIKITGLPTYFLLNRDKHIIKIFTGSNFDELNDFLRSRSN